MQWLSSCGNSDATSHSTNARYSAPQLPLGPSEHASRSPGWPATSAQLEGSSSSSGGGSPACRGWPSSPAYGPARYDRHDEEMISAPANWASGEVREAPRHRDGVVVQGEHVVLEIARHPGVRQAGLEPERGAASAMFSASFSPSRPSAGCLWEASRRGFGPVRLGGPRRVDAAASTWIVRIGQPRRRRDPSHTTPPLHAAVSLGQ